MKYLNVLFSFCLLISGCSNKEDRGPNVIFILTDDQGYGDFSCHGNKWVHTPNLDKLYEESLRFTNFHTGTTCAPSRAGLISGRYPNKVGVWHTIQGREYLKKGVTTLPEILNYAGYSTAIFGKWHLGDVYPFRPQDRGFDEALIHGGGGIGQVPDFWNNDYFDDVYFRNGLPERFNGYCTDIWFSEATKWIDKQKDKPFFCYISTNAPHSPFHIGDTYSAFYRKNKEIVSPNFYGMITNIDQNLGKLVDYLKKNGLFKNTIIAFMTDNGTSAGAMVDEYGNVVKGYNAGMRGLKGSEYEGGHRVPFFLLWKKGKITGGKDINELTSHIDFMPTILDLCGINFLSSQFDGKSLTPLIFDKKEDFPNRTLVVDTQRKEFLTKGKQSVVMTDRWRLVNGRELYDIPRDPGQKHNVGNQYPAVVDELRMAYENWWQDISIDVLDYQTAELDDVVDSIVLTSHDYHMEHSFPAWNQQMVRQGVGGRGFCVFTINRRGVYDIELRRWPKESGLNLSDRALAGNPIPGGIPYQEGLSMNITGAVININDKIFQKEVDKKASAVVFSIELDEGDYRLTPEFIDGKGSVHSVYYVYIKSKL